jgi:hypothetical protein
LNCLDTERRAIVRKVSLDVTWRELELLEAVVVDTVLVLGLLAR